MRKVTKIDKIGSSRNAMMRAARLLVAVLAAMFALARAAIAAEQVDALLVLASDVRSALWSGPASAPRRW